MAKKVQRKTLNPSKSEKKTTEKTTEKSIAKSKEKFTEKSNEKSIENSKGKTSKKSTYQAFNHIISSFLDNKIHLKPIQNSTSSKSKKDIPLSTAYVFVSGIQDQHQIKNYIEDLAPEWQKKTLLDNKKELIHFNSNQGPVWILSRSARSNMTSHQGQLEESLYAWARENAGTILQSIKTYKVQQVNLEFSATNHELDLGFLVGLEMTAYSFKSAQSVQDLPDVYLTKTEGSLEPDVLTEAKYLAGSVNLARHLVNLPPNCLNPESFEDMTRKLFAHSKNTKLEIWDEKKLLKENMGLHYAVGQGALHGPRMLHLKYRPHEKSSKKSSKKTTTSASDSMSSASGTTYKPIAFVGKGITFDTGGLDIKPSSAMRLMKKDMGGAAAVLGVALWAELSDVEYDLDFYIGLAENSVDQKSFRPSDVVKARNGLSVEIHNTDAEGRLVLADVLDVAVTQPDSDEPEMVIDIATLTGAIKVALGADLAGLFSNSDDLSERLQLAGQKSGDLNWRMPLYLKYTQGMNSSFADIVNAVDGFGGAITAALFLEKFVRNKPWAHLDIYAWNDKATGSLSFSGGNGQAVQSLVQFIKSL